MPKTCLVLLSIACSTLPFAAYTADINSNNTSLTPAPETSFSAEKDKQKSTVKVNKIVVQSNPIFDESDPESFFIHHWANYLHINTTDSTIIDNLSFEVGDDISQKDIEEAQRLLRSESYIRDAKITVTQKAPDADDTTDQTMLVETWDNWSLLPTVSLSKNGGGTKYSFGIKEDNLLGLGINTRVKYQASDDRTGYKFAFSAPVTAIKHAIVAADFYDNSDGQATALAFYKPFYALDTKHMYGTSWVQDERTDIIRQNGVDVNEFKHNVEFANLTYGWLLTRDQDELSRVTFGLTQDSNKFENIEMYPLSELPVDRDFIYPWVGYEYLQDEFTVLNNIHLIGNNEDFNLGWHHSVKLGFETNDVADNADLGYHLNILSSRGWQSDNHLFLIKLQGEADLATSQDDFYNVSLASEYFYNITDKWTAFAKASIATSKNNYLDRTFALGDETGIRGYPNDYQHGDNQWVLTAELRNYPNINLYQLADLGWALFTDVGQAFGGTDAFNEVNDPIGSIGIGARIYSSKSSYGNIAHIDIAKPFTNGQDLNSWEFRFQIKDHF
jgi:outer membrane protein assembly factor BamA